MAVERETVDLFEHLCMQIKNIGIESVHGVPGEQLIPNRIITQRIMTDSEIKATSTWLLWTMSKSVTYNGSETAMNSMPVWTPGLHP